MIIRFIDENDSRFEISGIYEQSWKYAYKDIIPQDYLDSIPEGRWASGIDNPEKHNLVIENDGKLVGTSCIMRSRWENYPDFGEIVSIYLLPEYIGRGYGKKLLARAVKELYDLGFDRVLIWVLEENKKARKFYELNGFHFSGEFRTDNIGGKELKEILYISEDKK